MLLILELVRKFSWRKPKSFHDNEGVLVFIEMLQVHLSGSVLISAAHTSTSKIFWGGHFLWKWMCSACKAF